MSTPTQQKALFLQSKLGEFALATRNVPTPGAGDILVKNEAVGLNPVDWKVQTYGLFIEDYPVILGFDAAGTVETVGEGVTAFKKGDFAEAIARYKAAYEIEPEMPHYQLNLAAAYLKVQKCVVGLALALALSVC